MRTFLNTCGIVLILFVLVTFCMKNTQQVQISYYTDISVKLPLWTVILVPFFIGVIAGSLLDVIKILSLKKEIRQLKKEITTAQDTQTA